MSCKPSLIRGNAGEIMTLSGIEGRTRGTDSVASVEECESIARDLAESHGCVVVVSGKVDYVRTCPFILQREMRASSVQTTMAA